MKDMEIFGENLSYLPLGCFATLDRTRKPKSPVVLIE